MTESLTIFSTTAHSVTSTPYTFEPDLASGDPNALNDPKPWLVRVWSNTGIHIRSDGQDATTSDYPLAALLHGAIMNVPPGGSISVVKQTGEADGVAWFSHVKRG